MIDPYERAFDEYWSKQWQMSDNDPATNRARFVIAHGAFEAGLDLFWKENDRLLCVIESLQLPQPVDPVQCSDGADSSGGHENHAEHSGLFGK